MHFLTFISLLTASAITALGTPQEASSAIVTTKITPSYWRATFSNPPLNLENNAWFKDFYNLVDEIANDPNVSVVVFDSSAENFWIAHFDVFNPVSPEYTGPAYWGNVTRLANLPVLTVAAIRGIVRGGGAELAAALDVRFGSKEKAILGQLEVGTGVFPGGGGLRLLPRLTGRSRALEIVIGADDFDADTAALYGWINRAIPDDQFEDFVDKFARRVAGWDRYAITQAKSIINKVTGFPAVQDVQDDFAAFEVALSQGVVPSRLEAIAKAGFQTNETFEIHIAEEELRFIGPGPWNV